MRNIDCNELTANELEAVSGGEYSFWPSAPSKETVQKISAVAGAVVAASPAASPVTVPLATGAGAVFLFDAVWHSSDK